MLTGCSGAEDLAEVCGEARRLPSGACCGPWTIAVDGSCERRLWQSLDNTVAGPVGQLEVAVAADGTGLAAWLRQGHCFVGEQTPTTWESIAVSAGLDGIATGLVIAASLDGSALVGWQQVDAQPTGAFVSSRSAPGAWTRPQDDDRVSFDNGTSAFALALGAAGDAVYVWNQVESLGILAATRAPEAGSFRRPADGDDWLSPEGFFTNKPKVAVNASGDAVIAWFQSIGEDLLVWASERTGGAGEFSRPLAGQELSLDRPGPELGPYYVDNTQTAIHDAGHAVVVWEHPYDELTALQLSTRDPDGTWHIPASPIETFTVQEGTARLPLPVFSRGGDLFIIWWHEVGDARTVMLAHRLHDGTWLHPGSAPLQLSAPGVWATDPRIAVGSDGGVVAAWLERDDETDTMRVVSRRTHDTWEGAWENGVVLATAQPGAAMYAVSLAIGTSHERVLAGWVEGGVGSFASID